jgi:hypothetical protein
MPGFSNTVEQKILDAIFGGTAYTVTSPVYLALTTVAVTETDTGSTITEAAYTGYARKSIASADMGAATTSGKTNVNPITFAGCTAGTSTVVGFAICSASTAGDVILYGTLPSVVISTTQTPATIAAGALTATLD